MSVSMYRISVPVFVRGLKALSGVLKKGEEHAKEQGLPPSELIEARLAPDMFALAAQIQRASDTAKFCVKRVLDVEAPTFNDEEASFEELQQRIAATIAYLESVPETKFEGSERRTVTLNFGEFKPSFSGADYVFDFALPNFYFHVATAYDILRHMGVPVGKRDFLGEYP